MCKMCLSTVYKKEPQIGQARFASKHGKRSQCELEASMERNDLPFQSRRRLCTLAYCSMPARCQKHRALQPKDSYWLGCKARVTRVQPQVVQPAGTLSLALSPLRLQHCDHHDSQPFPPLQTDRPYFFLASQNDGCCDPAALGGELFTKRAPTLLGRIVLGASTFTSSKKSVCS